MTQNLWIKVAFLTILFWASGCVPLATQGPSVPEVTLQTTVPPTVTLTPTSSEVPATATSSPSPTATHQPPTATPQPTLSAVGMKMVILDLMKGNGGCRLPCLWGLNPGEIDYHTFHSFLGQFYNLDTPEIYVSIWNLDVSQLFTLSYREDSTHIFIQLSDIASEEGDRLSMLTMNGYSMGEYGTTPEGALDLRPQYGDALFTQTLQYYTLPNILSTYGPPARVLLATWPDDPERPDIKAWPFSLVLLYPEQGIFVEYVSVRETVEDHFAGCPSKSHIYLGVWSPERALPLNYVVQKAGSVINELNLDYFKSVEEATSLTLDEFYETFKNPDNTACIETPIEFWAEP